MPATTTTLARISALLFLALSFRASAEPAHDADLPQPLDLSFAQSLATQSPFTRSVNLEESLQLTGVAYIEGRPVATILNKATKQSLMVSEEPNELGWKLMEASTSTDLNNTEIHLMVGPEIITMHYGNAQLEPGSGKGKGGNRVANTGSANGGEQKFRASSFLGDKGHDLYVSLSPDARIKFKGLVKDFVDKRPESTPEQTSAYAQKVFNKIKATDQPTTGASVKSAKVAKPSKNKAGM